MIYELRFLVVVVLRGTLVCRKRSRRGREWDATEQLAFGRGGRTLALKSCNLFGLTTGVLLCREFGSNLRRCIRSDTVPFQDVVHLTLDFGATRTLDALLGGFEVEREMAQLGLSREKATDAHRDGTGDEFGQAGKHDELGGTGGRKTGRQRKRNRETVAETDDAVAGKVGVDQRAVVGCNHVAAADKGGIVLLSGRAFVVGAERGCGGRGDTGTRALRSGLVVGAVGVSCGGRPEEGSGFRLVGSVVAVLGRQLDGSALG